MKMPAVAFLVAGEQTQVLLTICREASVGFDSGLAEMQVYDILLVNNVIDEQVARSPHEFRIGASKVSLAFVVTGDLASQAAVEIEEPDGAVALKRIRAIMSDQPHAEKCVTAVWSGNRFD